MKRTTLGSLVLLALVCLLSPARAVHAQGVTTSGVNGVVKDAQGAVVPGATVSVVTAVRNDV